MRAVFSAAFLLPILALIPACTRCQPASGAQDPVSLTVGGKAVTVSLFVKYEERRHAIEQNKDLKAGAGLLLCCARNRYQSVWNQWTERILRVDFINDAGELLDTQIVDPSIKGADGHVKGVTSAKETKFALITLPETLQGTTVKVGDKIELPDKVKNCSAEEMPVLKIGQAKVYVDLSTSYDQRQRGLMYRKPISGDDGMLFAYSRPGERNFWMGGTLIPLSLAYIKPDSTISQLHDMECYKDPDKPPSPHPTWPSKEEVQYVLEVNLGFFKANGIKEGDKVEFPPELKNFTPE